MPAITKIHARQILDSRGNPTVETDVYLADGSFGRAAVPSGASTGSNEALELRDGDKNNYFGQSVLKAVGNVNVTMADSLTKAGDLDQEKLDKHMLELDGTEAKSKLGANAILSVSLAFAWAVTQSQKRPLFRYIGELYGNSNFIMPRPMFNIMNGGKHANWATDIQEYMVLPLKDLPWEERLRIGSEIFHALEKVLKENNLSTNVGNEGGFAPALESNQQALDFIVQAVDQAGYKLGEDVACGFDAAASEFYNPDSGMYDLKRDKVSLSSDEMVSWAKELQGKYNVISYEDFLSEADWAGWAKITEAMGADTQIVGDDLLVTNVKMIQRAIAEKSCNALLVKVNQIGTLTESIAAMKLAQQAGWNNVVSHRSGETEDVTIAHLVVGTGAGQIKTGAPSRGERTAKYNELIRISEQI